MLPTQVFIIDDDIDDIDLFREALQEINGAISCLSSQSGAEALEILEKQDTYPDLIFLDLNMPGLNGKECLVKLKASKRLGDIPVYIYSTSILTSDFEDTRKLGASGYLSKPTNFDTLKTALSQIFAKA